MAECIYIDNTDIYAEFCAYPIGYEGVIGWPKFKPVQTVEWPDEEGVDANLEAPKYDAHQCSITFCVGKGKIHDFMAFVYEYSVRDYYFPALGTNKKLRLIGRSELSFLFSLGLATLTFSDDSPMEGYIYQEPQTTIDNARHLGKLTIDGIDLTSYGCVMLAGTASSVNSQPNVGEVLAIDVSNKKGESVDVSAPLIKRERDVTLHLLMKAGSVAEFWRNYNALLHDLARPGERDIIYMEGISFQAFYGEQNVEYLSLPRYEGDSVWCEFSLTLTTLTPFYVLASEEWDIITDETATYYIRL